MIRGVKWTRGDPPTSVDTAPGRFVYIQVGEAIRRFDVLSPGNQSIVLSVRPNPEPNKIGTALDGKCPVVQAHTHRPVLPDLLEVQRWMMRILTQKCITPIRQLSHFVRKCMVAGPESRAGAMFHRSVQRPSSRSRNASSANRSNRPAATSCSICRSQTSASKEANQSRSAARSFGSRPRMACSIS